MGDECSPPCEQALCHWESNRGTHPDRPGSRSAEPASRPSEARLSNGRRPPLFVKPFRRSRSLPRCLVRSNHRAIEYEFGWARKLAAASFLRVRRARMSPLARTLQHLCSPARDAVRWMHSLPCGDSGRDVIAFLVRRQVSGLHTLLRTTAPGKSAATSGGIDCGLAAPPTPALLVQLDSSNSRLSKPTKPPRKEGEHEGQGHHDPGATDVH